MSNNRITNRPLIRPVPFRTIRITPRTTLRGKLQRFIWNRGTLFPRRVSRGLLPLATRYALFCGIGAILWGYAAIPAILLITTLYSIYTWSAQRQEIVRENYFERTARGRKLLTIAEAQAAAISLLDATRPIERFEWAKTYLDRKLLYSHALVCGAVGSGKTLFFRIFLNWFLPTILPGSDRRLMVYDHKCEMFQILLSNRRLRCQIRTLNPFDTRAFALDIARDITTTAGAYQAATIFLPVETRDTQPFFRDAARNILAAVISFFVKHHPRQWTLRQVLLVCRSQRYMRSLLASDAEFAPVVENYLDVGETTLASVLSTLATHLTPLEVVAALWDRCPRKFSVTEWLQSHSIVILGGDSRFKSTLDKVNALILSLTTHKALSLTESETRLNVYLLDEAREFGKQSALPVQQLIISGRSKGNSVWLGIQAIEGLEEVWGEKTAHEVAGQTGLKAFFKQDSPRSAEWASKCVGDRERFEVQISNSRSAQGGSNSESIQKHTRPQVMPSELLDLPATGRTTGLHGVFLARGVGVWKASYLPTELNHKLGSPIDRTIPGQIDAPQEWQRLRPFTPAELRRLRLSDDDTTQAPVPPVEPPPETSGAFTPLRPLVF